MANPNKPSLIKRTAVAATASLGLLAGASLVEAPARAEAAIVPPNAGNSRNEYVGAILRTHANQMPKVVFGVLKACKAFPANCNLRGLTNSRYEVTFQGLRDPNNPNQSFTASYEASNVSGPDKFRVYKFEDRSRNIVERRYPEGVCVPDPSQCHSRVASVEYGNLQLDASYGGLGISTQGGGEFDTSWGNRRPYIQHSAGAEFLAIMAVSDFANAVRL